MLSFIKLMRDHAQMIAYFHEKTTVRAQRLIDEHIEAAIKGSGDLLDGTERAEKLAALNTEVMEIISADFAAAVAKKGVVDRLFATVKEYPPTLPVTVLPKPHLPASISASNKFCVLSSLVLDSLYLMLQWRLYKKTFDNTSFNNFVDSLSKMDMSTDLLHDINSKRVSSAWKTIVQSIKIEKATNKKKRRYELVLNFLRDDFDGFNDDDNNDSVSAPGLQAPPSKVPKYSAAAADPSVPPAECNTDVLPNGGKRLALKSKECALPPPTATLSAISITSPAPSLALLDTRNWSLGVPLDVSTLFSPDRQESDDSACPLCQRHITAGVSLIGCRKRHFFCKECILSTLDFSSQVSPGSYKVFCPECGVSSEIPTNEFLGGKVDHKSALVAHNKADALLDSWASIDARLSTVKSVVSGHFNDLDAKIQGGRERIADTFAALAGECSAILEEKRRAAVGTVDTLSGNLRAAFDGFSRISRDVEEKTAALSALCAKAKAPGVPRGERRAAAKRAREILAYLEAYYAPLRNATPPSLEVEAAEEFRPVVSVGSSMKDFSEHLKDYATLVNI